MATNASVHRVDRPIPADVPSERSYESREDATLDKKMCDAIEAAEAVDNDHIAKVLALELGAHYYRNGE